VKYIHNVTLNHTQNFKILQKQKILKKAHLNPLLREVQVQGIPPADSYPEGKVQRDHRDFLGRIKKLSKRYILVKVRVGNLWGMRKDGLDDMQAVCLVEEGISEND
jgi:hypothetical protein